MKSNSIFKAHKKTYYCNFSTFLIFIFIFCCLIYLKTLFYPFIYDDSLYILNNEGIKDLHNFWPPYGTRYFGYLSFGINYSIFGLNTAGFFRLTNILIHFANSIAIYALLSMILKTPALKESFENKKEISSIIPFTAALFFFTHPIQTQAVIYISQRFTALATLFYLVALILFLKFKQSDKKIFYFLTFLIVLLAQKTKEINFTLPFMIALVDFTFYRTKLRDRSYLIIFFLATAIIPAELFLSKNFVGAELAQAQKDDLSSISPYFYFLTEFGVILMYLRLLFLPINQALVYDFPLLNSFWNPQVFMPFIILLIILGSTICFYFDAVKSNRPKALLVSFGILFFFLTSSVESSFIPIKDVAFEHRLYLPSIGIITSSSVLFASALEFVSRKLKCKYIGFSSVLMLLIVLLAPLSYASFKRSAVWSSEEAMWADNVEKAPKSPNANYNLALVYHNKNIDKAIYYYNQAIINKPDYHKAHQNIGIAYLQKGEAYKGVQHLEKAVKLSENYKAYRALGEAYNQIGDYDSAIYCLTKSIELNPDYGPSHFNLAKTLARVGKANYAKIHFLKSIELNYNSKEAMFELRNLKTAQDDFKR